MGDLGKLVVAKGFKKLPKVQKFAQSGHTAHKPSNDFCEISIAVKWVDEIYAHVKHSFGTFLGRERGIMCFYDLISLQPFQDLLQFNFFMICKKYHLCTYVAKTRFNYTTFVARTTSLKVKTVGSGWRKLSITLCMWNAINNSKWKAIYFSI